MAIEHTVPTIPTASMVREGADRILAVVPPWRPGDSMDKQCITLDAASALAHQVWTAMLLAAPGDANKLEPLTRAERGALQAALVLPYASLRKLAAALGKSKTQTFRLMFQLQQKGYIAHDGERWIQVGGFADD